MFAIGVGFSALGNDVIPELHVSAIDIGSTDHFLIWANIDRSRKIKSKKQRKVFRWKVERLGDDGTRDEFQKGLAGSVESFRKLLRSVEDGQVDVQAAGDRVIEGWESIVNATAERVVGKKVVRCGVSVKWWDDELKEEIGERREVFKQYLSEASEESWEKYRAKRKQVKGLVKKKKKCIWDEVVQKANGGLEGNVKQMWEGISGMVKKTAQGGDTGVATLRGVNGGLVSSGKGKREVLAGHYKRLGVPSENEAFDQAFKKEVDAWAQKEEETSKADVGNVELEKEFTEDEVEACVNKLKCHKAAGADGIVNEFMKFGGKGMIQLMVLLYNWVWKNEYTPSRWREGVVVNLFKKGDKTDPGNYRGITLLNTVGKVFCKLLNDRIVGVLEKEHSISEGQAGFRKKRGCVDHVFTVGRIIQGRKRAGKPTYCFFLDVKKAYDTVWRNGLWKQLSKYGIKGKMWRVLKKMTECTKSAVMLDGELSKFFDIEQGVPQGCTLSPTLFQVFINDLLEVVEAVRKGVKVGDTETSVSGMLFADDFVGMSDTPEGLQLQIDAAKKFTDKWRLSANVQKSAVMVCNENKEEPVEHRWKWGIEEIAVVDQYTYLGVEIAKDCSWNAHMSKVAEKGKARAGKLHPILANRHLDTRIKLTVLKSVIVPPLEYAGEVWEGNKKVVKELEAAQMKAAKTILGCSRRTSNAAVRAELGIQSLRSGRDARKLTWQYRMCGMGEERLPRIVWEAKWANKKRGRQPTEWVKVVEDVWKGLDIDEDETLETEGLQGFKEKISVACAEREEQNLRKESKDKEGLEVYGMLKEGIGFKDYLHGPMDAGTKLKVKFRTGDIGLRERRRRHRTVDEEDDEFKCDCGFECEDRVHVVAECPLYKKEREVYVTELGKIDGTYREMFEAWNRGERTVAVLGHRRWVEKAGRDIVRIDRLGKTFLSHLWQSRKERLAIGDRSCGNNAPSSRGRVVNGLTAK
ncbi:unnamed protein product [Ectocarpus sp. CCAP 1310/34]|nr:unnamed protein product [Ectocarpus sp. CCAP 1310/34]